MKMKIKMLKLGQGPEGCFMRGHEYEVSENIGKQLLSDNACYEIKTEPREIKPFIIKEVKSIKKEKKSPFKKKKKSPFKKKKKSPFKKKK